MTQNQLEKAFAGLTQNEITSALQQVEFFSDSKNRQAVIRQLEKEKV